MYRALSKALSSLLLVFAALLALLWHAIATYPVWAAVIGLPTIGFVALVGHEMRRQARAAHDARMRDEHVPSMSPLEYEQFSARLLGRAGWRVKHCGRSGDQGADLFADLRGFRAVVQCKLYRGRVGNSAVQEAAAARRHYNAQIMVVVAPNGFTKSAYALAASNGVHLLHHSELVRLAQLSRIP